MDSCWWCSRLFLLLFSAISSIDASWNLIDCCYRRRGWMIKVCSPFSISTFGRRWRGWMNDGSRTWCWRSGRWHSSYRSHICINRTTHWSLSSIEKRTICRSNTVGILKTLAEFFFSSVTSMMTWHSHSWISHAWKSHSWRIHHASHASQRWHKSIS